MATLSMIRLNTDPEIHRIPIDNQHICIVVDNFLKNPQALIDFACSNVDHFYTTPAGYPGPVMNLHPGLLDEFHRFIRTRMSREFGFLRGDPKLKTGLAMTTLPPEKLANFQRLCHIDPRGEPGRRNYAALVYLYDNEKLGGTAFYRWKMPDLVSRALALEMQDPSAAAAFLAEHTATFRRTPQYMTESNELAELLTVIAPRFNRLIFYSGEIPHSGHIKHPELLSTDFRRGRLALNCFASVLPR